MLGIDLSAPEKVEAPKPLAQRLRDWGQMAFLLLCVLAGVGVLIWAFLTAFLPAAASVQDTIHRLGPAGSWNYYSDAFRKSVNNWEPIERLFWEILIICGLVVWSMSREFDHHGEKMENLLEKVKGELLEEVKESLEELKASIEAVNEDLKAGVEGVNGDLKEAKKDLASKVEDVETSLAASVHSLEQSVEDLRQELLDR